MRTFDEVRLEHYTNHPEEIDTLLEVSFEDCLVEDKLYILSDAINIACIVRNINAHAEDNWDSIMRSLKVLGYGLVPKQLDKAA
jgi:hypothetical protein